MKINFILPPGMSFWQGLQFGYVPTADDPAYIRWLHTLPCCVSGTRHNITAHHVIGHGLKAVGGKTSDYLAIPLSAELHLADFPGGLHRGHKAWEVRHGSQLEFSARTLLQAVYEGVLKL